MFWEYLVSSIINVTATLFCIYSILGKKVDLRKSHNYIGYVILIISGVILIYSEIEIIRPINFFVIFLIYSYFLIEKNIKNIAIANLVTQFVIIASELIIVIPVFFIGNSTVEEFNIEVVGTTSLNCLISLMMLGVLKTNLPLRIYKKLISITIKTNYKTILGVAVFIVLSLYIIVFSIYVEYNALYLLIFNIWLTSIYVIIMYIFIKEKDSNKYYQEENEHLMKILNRFETLFSYEKANNHENKNQFLIIEEMIKNKDEGLLDYVKAIIKENKKENKSIFSKVKKIPSGGLQGIIYRKILTMKESKIKYKVNISKEIKQDSLEVLTNVENYNLCRIIGVFLDNAIDESVKSKEKEIFISMYKENDIIIEISNYCKDLPDMSKIGKKKYTTKSSTHGYGLMLVSKIISESKCCQNEHRISENIFTQIIKIKM